MKSTSTHEVQAVIFDLDGTLVDSLRDIAEAVNHALAAIGLPTHAVAPYAGWVGDGLPMLCRRAMREQEPDRVDEVVHLAAEHYRVHYLDHSRLYPGIADLLGVLTEQRVGVAVLSNKPHEFTVSMVRAMCSPWRFAAVEGYREEHLRKPNPATALRLCAQLEREPARAAFVGDSSIDIETGINAGMIPIGVAWGFRSIDELQDAGARYILDEPNDLLKLLAC